MSLVRRRGPLIRRQLATAAWTNLAETLPPPESSAVTLTEKQLTELKHDAWSDVAIVVVLSLAAATFTNLETTAFVGFCTVLVMIRSRRKLLNPEAWVGFDVNVFAESVRRSDGLMPLEGETPQELRLRIADGLESLGPRSRDRGPLILAIFMTVASLFSAMFFLAFDPPWFLPVGLLAVQLIYLVVHRSEREPGRLGALEAIRILEVQLEAPPGQGGDFPCRSPIGELDGTPEMT